MREKSAIDERIARIAWDNRADLIATMRRLTKMPLQAAEDCVSEAIIGLLSNFDAVSITDDALRSGVAFETQVYVTLRHQAEKAWRKERKHISKTISDATPIGGEDDDLTLASLMVPRLSSAAFIEAYAECMMFFRKGRSRLSDDDINTLFGLADGVTAELEALERGCHVSKVRADRASFANKRRLWGLAS